MLLALDLLPALDKWLHHCVLSAEGSSGSGGCGSCSCARSAPASLAGDGSRSTTQEPLTRRSSGCYLIACPSSHCHMQHCRKQHDPVYAPERPYLVSEWFSCLAAIPLANSTAEHQLRGVQGRQAEDQSQMGCAFALPGCRECCDTQACYRHCFAR